MFFSCVTEEDIKKKKKPREECEGRDGKLYEEILYRPRTLFRAVKHENNKKNMNIIFLFYHNLSGLLVKKKRCWVALNVRVFIKKNKK